MLLLSLLLFYLYSDCRQYGAVNFTYSIMEYNE